MAWYKSEEDYERLKSIFSDSSKLPSSYKDWLNSAETGFRELTSKGRTVERVYLDPNTFPDWCRSHNLKIDAQARMEFANEFVARKYGAKK